jgi:poly(3-hydroxybutyrate) depolymerase/soluble P-type ATPase
VVTFRQRLTDLDTIAALAATEVERRYLVYAPANLPNRPAPVVLVFPGYSSSAEGIAYYDTHTRFETLADRDGFIVVYGNGLPTPPSPREHASIPKGGFLSGCMARHAGEGVDVSYVRQILDQLGAELPIDRARIYATGFSAGGGMSFDLALEAPDLVAAIAPVAPLPFLPTGGWLLHCHPQAGHDSISIAMVAATDDPFITYGGGGSREYPQARYPGMERVDAAPFAARAEDLRQEAQTVIFVVVDGRPAGLLGVADPIKESTPDAMRTLHGENVRIVMLTGDSRTTAEAVARKLDIDEVVAEVLPDQKASVVKRLQAEGRVVAMAGDGINDAPALAQAHVGIAMGTGTDVAMESAGVTLVKGDLRAIARARRISRQTLANIKQNLFFAFVYNVAGVPVAAGILYPWFGILLNPMMAAAAMSLSSVSVVGNALRLRRTQI